MNKKILIGIDEAGRGPLAGPVSVCAFVVLNSKGRRLFKGVKDSKQLSEKQREEWFQKIKEEQEKGNIAFRVSFSNSKTIDKKGIVYAVYSSLNRCLRKLERKGYIGKDTKILMDGSLRASSKYTDQKTIIGGDRSQPIIALASICAKVLRDRYMKRVAIQYPRFGFEIHKGYGTVAHYKAIKEFGYTDIHRLTYLKL